MILSLIMLSGCGRNSEEMILLNDAVVADSGEEIIKTSFDNTIESANDKDSESKALEENPKLSFVVFVCGAVNKPGVYEVNEGARIFDVIEKAEGYRSDAAFTYLNLAEGVSDGQKIYVPTLYEVESGNLSASGGAVTGINNGIGGGGSSSSSSSDGNSLVNINKATEDELRTLPGVGESKAKAIISYREENGGFKKIEDIMEISGIKTNLFNKVKDRICVD